MVQWKYIIWANSDSPITNLACEKVWFTINGSLKILFFNFCLFRFSKFQMTNIMNNKKSYNEFRRFLGSSTTSQIFLTYMFLTMKWRPFWNLQGNAFCFFILPKWKKYWNLTFDATFKLRTVEYAISVFSISYLYLFYWGFSKKIYEIIIIF